MSTAAEAAVETPEAPDVPEEDSGRSWLENLIRQWALIKVGHDAMMLDKIQKQNGEVLALARATRTGTLGKPDPSQGDDAMGVQVGNEHKEYHYHYATAQNAASTVQTGARALSTAGKAAVLGAAVLGGGGLGALAMNYLSQPDPPAVVQPVDPSAYGFDGESVRP